MQKTVSINVGLLLYPGFQQTVVSGLIDFFSVTNQIVKKRWVKKGSLPQINVVEITEPVVNSNLPSFITEDSSFSFSVLVIPPCLDRFSFAQINGYMDFLQYCFNQGTILASIDKGVFLLARSGILNGHKATVHWQFENEFRRKYPKVQIDAVPLVVEDGKVITTAGLLSWSDLGLLLVKKFFGAAIMAEVAHVLLLQPTERFQSHFSLFHPCFSHDDSAILKGQKWIAEQTELNITLDQLSQVTALENRTLQRRFVKATGMTVTEYLQRFRVCKAQSLLQFTNTSIDIIGKKCGYKDPNAFRKIFIKIVGLSPGLYRKNFMV